MHASHPHVNGVAGGVGIDAAIKEKAPDVEIYAVKVFDRELSTNAAVLVRAIDWASSRGVRLINLSLGTAKPEREEMLQSAVDRAGERGSFVVAASSHDGQRWLPGSLRGALGVMLDWDCDRDEVRITTDAHGSATFHASGYPRPIPNVSPERNLKGISFAVANTTGMLARLLEAHPDATTVADVVEAVGRRRTESDGGMRKGGQADKQGGQKRSLRTAHYSLLTLSHPRLQLLEEVEDNV